MIDVFAIRAVPTGDSNFELVGWAATASCFAGDANNLLNDALAIALVPIT